MSSHDGGMAAVAPGHHVLILTQTSIDFLMVFMMGYCNKKVGLMAQELPREGAERAERTNISD